MIKLKAWALSILMVACAPVVTLACIWDYDTLKQERARFPTTLELITGKFLRHSREFYEWRIKDRLEKIKASPEKVYLVDDLAVAYHKTGQHEKAVQTMLDKEKMRPGVYETYSNLGTFYILAGDFEQGLPLIDKALKINPDAHFGREKYQKWLVEYAQTKMKDGKLTFPLRPVNPEKQDRETFATFVSSKLHDPTAANPEHMDLTETQSAIVAVLGMMRFANHDNPLLLEALADLLLFNRRADAKRLAARAYLMASKQMKEETSKRAYRECADMAKSGQTENPYTTTSVVFVDLEKEFDAELAEAERWYGELKAKELKWISEGKDAEREFDRQYEPAVAGRSTWVKYLVWSLVGVVGLVISACILLPQSRKLFKA